MRFFLFIFAFLISTFPLNAAHAASTWLCNATSETLYVSVRHYAPSIVVQNARTEGWRRLPVRGLMRSCWIVNRTSRDHIVVVGVLSGGKIVPIKLTPRNASARRDVFVCVPLKSGSYEYRSGSRSDRACSADYQLARASFSVEGGSNDVDIDLSGAITIRTDPDPRERKQLEAARQRAEQRRKEEAAKKAARKEYDKIYHLSDGEYIRTAKKSTEKNFEKRIENWYRFLEDKTLLLRGDATGKSRGERKYDVWIRLSRADKDAVLRINSAIAFAVEAGSRPPHALRLLSMPNQKSMSTEDARRLEAFFSDPGFSSRVGQREIRAPLFSQATVGNTEPTVPLARDHDTMMLTWRVDYIPHLTSDGFNSRNVPILCFNIGERSDRPKRYLSCFRLKYTKAQGAELSRLDLHGIASPRDVLNPLVTRKFSDVVARGF